MIWPETLRSPAIAVNIAAPRVWGVVLPAVIPPTTPEIFRAPNDKAVRLLEKSVVPPSVSAPLLLVRVTIPPVSWALAVVVRSPVEVMFRALPALVTPSLWKMPPLVRVSGPVAISAPPVGMARLPVAVALRALVALPEAVMAPPRLRLTPLSVTVLPFNRALAVVFRSPVEVMFRALLALVAPSLWKVPPSLRESEPAEVRVLPVGMVRLPLAVALSAFAPVPSAVIAPLRLRTTPEIVTWLAVTAAAEVLV